MIHNVSKFLNKEKCRAEIKVSRWGKVYKCGVGSCLYVNFDVLFIVEVLCSFFFKRHWINLEYLILISGLVPLNFAPKARALLAHPAPGPGDGASVLRLLTPPDIWELNHLQRWDLASIHSFTCHSKLFIIPTLGHALCRPLSLTCSPPLWCFQSQKGDQLPKQTT